MRNSIHSRPPARSVRSLTRAAIVPPSKRAIEYFVPPISIASVFTFKHLLGRRGSSARLHHRNGRDKVPKTHRLVGRTSNLQGSGGACGKAITRAANVDWLGYARSLNETLACLIENRRPRATSSDNQQITLYMLLKRLKI